MADLDTYDADQRGYDGEKPASKNTSTQSTPHTSTSFLRTPGKAQSQPRRERSDSIFAAIDSFSHSLRDKLEKGPLTRNIPAIIITPASPEKIITPPQQSLSEGKPKLISFSLKLKDDREYPARDRSRSPGPDRDGDTRLRDEPVNGRNDRDHAAPNKSVVDDDGEEAANSGSNLFVTGIHPRLTEDEISRLFEKYGQVEKCNIMRDPHTRESRGFGFVNMRTSDEADAAKEALQGEVYEGRTLSIEKARRSRPRTPTPGKYFGPPKRDDRPSRGGFRDRYDDRGYGRRDDYRRGGGGGGYRDRYDDRGYGGRRDDYGGRAEGRDGRERDGRSDRYRDDRYSDRRGGGYGGYDRPPRGPPESGSYGGGGDFGGARDPPSRSYDDRRRYD